MKPTKTPDPDTPLTSAEFMALPKFRGIEELPGESQAAVKKLMGRPPKPDKKVPLHLRVDPEVAARFRATGKGWQTRLNAILRELVDSGRL